MALIECKECGNTVSTKATTCPACGAKVPKMGLLGTIACGAIFWVLFNIVLTDGHSPKATEDLAEENLMLTGCIAAQDAITAKLQAPSTARFPPCGQNTVNMTPDKKKMTLVTYVDSQNAFGAVLRMGWSVSLQRDGGTVDMSAWKVWSMSPLY